MIKYREHRGGLQESLDTAREFDSIKELFYYLVNWSQENRLSYNIEDFTIRFYGFDERCNQDLWIVTARGQGIGFIFEELGK